MTSQGIIRKTIRIDAKDQAVGRIATQIAIKLRGKDEPEYAPNVDKGAVVEVFNIGQMKFTGKKLDQKVYYHFSGYPSGLKTKKMSKLNAENPGDILRRAVREMLPDNRLRNGMLKRLIIK